MLNTALFKQDKCGADAAVCSSRIVDWNVAKTPGFVDQDPSLYETSNDCQKRIKLKILRKFLDSHYLPLEYFQTPTESETIVCRCENVSVADIREVAALGCMGPNQGKASTRCGMGPCMGRQCSNTVSQLFANYHNRSVADIGHYRIRPPLKPLTLKQLSNLDLSR